MNYDYLAFSPRLKRIFETGTSVRRDGETVSVSAASSTLNNLRVIRGLVKEHRPHRTLEVGLAYGASALTILATLREIHGESDYRHAAIDPFQNYQWGGSSLRVIEEEGFADHFDFHESFSAFALPQLARERKRFDFIYIDGSHIFEDVFIDFYYSAMLLTEGGVMLFDDCTDKHVAKVLRFIRRNYAGILAPVDMARFGDPGKTLVKRVANRLGYRQLVGFTKISEPPRKWDVALANF